MNWVCDGNTRSRNCVCATCYHYDHCPRSVIILLALQIESCRQTDTRSWLRDKLL